MERRIPDTSLEAYQSALESGLINRIQFEVIEFFAKYDRERGHTTKEILAIIGVSKQNNSWERLQNYQKAMRPLKDKGVLIELEARVCEASATQRRAHPMRITWAMPTKSPKKPESKNEKISRLEARVKELEAQLEQYRFRELKSGGNLSLF